MQRLWRAFVALSVLVVGLNGISLPAQAAGEVVKPFGSLRPRYDVVIAGAGTGGTMAAVQAARLGANVLLIEETDWISGQMTAAGVSSMDEGGVGSRYGGGRPGVRDRGLYGEFVRRVVSYYNKLGLSTDTPAITVDHMAVEPRVAQRVMLEMLAVDGADSTSSVDLVLCTSVTSVTKIGNLITGAELEHETSSGVLRRHIDCTLLVDATELGSLIPMTGARYRVGNLLVTGAIPPTRNAVIQHFTWTALIKAYTPPIPPQLSIEVPPSGYDRAALLQVLDNPAATKTKYPWGWERFIGYRGTPDSSNPDKTIRNPWARVTRTHVNFAANDVAMDSGDLYSPARWRAKEAEMKLKTLRVLHHFRYGMKENVTTWTVATDEGYDTDYNRRQNKALVNDFPELKPYLEMLNHFPVKAYARESRRIVGLQTLRARDIDRLRSPVMFASSIAVGDYPVDVHGDPQPADLEPDLDLPEDLGAIGFTPKYMGPFLIPFETLVPESLDGFLVAEKNLSQSRLVNGATRLQPSTMLTGQAAGAVAALAVRYGLQPRHLNPMVVQSALLDAGDILYIDRKDKHKFAGVEPGSALWNDLQLALLYGLMQPLDTVIVHTSKHSSESLHITTAPLTGKWLATQMDRVFGPDAAWLSDMTTGTAPRGIAPEAVVTRGELASAWARTLGLKPPAAAGAAPSFSDMNATHPFYGDVEAVVRAGIAPKFFRSGQTRFDPDEPMTIANHVQMFAEVLKRQPADARLQSWRPAATKLPER